MIIINYWQHVSKHYLLSHLLLGVFVAGLSLSSQSTLLDAIFFDHSGHRITLTTTDHTYQTAFGQHPSQTQSVFLFVLHLFKSYFGRPYVDAVPRMDAAPRHGFNKANAIRAGPHTVT